MIKSPKVEAILPPQETDEVAAHTLGGIVVNAGGVGHGHWARLAGMPKSGGFPEYCSYQCIECGETQTLERHG
jgi:hypothetical protein